MAKSMPTAQMARAHCFLWRGPTAEQKRRWKKNRKAREAEQIAARYTAEARDGRAVKRAEEAEKREAEMAAKETKKTTNDAK